MLFAPPPPPSQQTAVELARYSRSLHDYTLRLWTESRRLAEEKARGPGGERALPRSASMGDARCATRRGSDSSSSDSSSDVPHNRRSLSRRRARETISDRDREHKHGRKDSGAGLGERLAAVAI